MFWKPFENLDRHQSIMHDRYFWNLNWLLKFEHRQQDFTVPVEVSLDGIKLWIFLYITALSISNSNGPGFPSILNLFFQLMPIPFKCQSRKYWSCVTGIDCKNKFEFDFSEADITCNLWRPHRVYDRNSFYIVKTVQRTQRHMTRFNQRRLEKIHKRFNGAAAVLDSQVRWHTADVVSTIFFLRATSFYSFHFHSIDKTALIVLIHYWSLLARSGFSRKVNNILIGCHLTVWRVVDISRLHINEGARRNK